MKAIVPMFTKESWEFHGQYYDFEARNVIPKPLQKPHPPLWVACSNIQTIGKAGKWGMGALGFTFVTPEAARAWVHKYYNNLLNNSQKLTDYPSNPNVAMVSGFMCAATDAEARGQGRGLDLLHLRALLLRPEGRRRPGRVGPLEGVPELEGRPGGEEGAENRA